MLGKSFKIVEPGRFDLYIEDIVAGEDEAIVRMNSLAICKADFRYYLGERDKRTLDFRYPLNLIHEAVGTIILDRTDTFKIGDKVALVPNIMPNPEVKCNHCVCDIEGLGENYCPNARFASSNYNGFSREFVNYPIRNLVKIPNNLNQDIAVFSELISVAISAYRRLSLRGDETIGVWGDGILGYILISTLRQIHSRGRIIAIGKHGDKLKHFPAHACYLSGDKNIAKEGITVSYECVGGVSSTFAINEMIESILTGGRIVLTGVAENGAQLNTRRILEKGLSLYGATRSKRSDFEQAVAIFENDRFREQISKLILNKIGIENISHYYQAFEIEMGNRGLGKNILNFYL